MLPNLRPDSESAPAVSLAHAAAPASPAALTGVERAAARTLHRYLRAIAARCRVTYMDETGARVDAARVGERVAAILAPRQPLIVTYWISDALAVALLPMVHPAFAELMSSVTCVVDDTFAGRVAGRYIETLGGRSTRLGLPGDLERLRQVQALMRRRASCAFPVDGGGPYRTAGTGIVTLASTLRASIVPLAACARPAFPPLHRSRVRLPAPASALYVAIGRPFVPAANDDRRDEATRVAAALNVLHGHVERSSLHSP